MIRARGAGVSFCRATRRGVRREAWDPWASRLIIVRVPQRTGAASRERAAYIVAEGPKTRDGDAIWAARRALLATKAATAGHLESCSPHTTMARADAVVRRRRFDVDDVLPLLIPAIALLTTTTRRRDPSIKYDAWHACVLTGCPDFPQANEAHSFPYLATFVSVLFLFGIMMAWQLMAQLGAISASLDSVRTDSKSKKKPPTTSSDGHESRRWREGAAAPRDRDAPRRPEGDDGY